MYTHDSSERAMRQRWFKMDKKIATSLSPNITRTHKSLDIGDSGTHAFYISMVEIGLSMKHPLFTDPVLRKHGVASAQYRFARPCTDGPLKAAGASPEQLALHDYAVVPLWEVGTEFGATLDLAHEDAAANVLPMRNEPYQMNEHEVENLAESVRILEKLNANLNENQMETGQQNVHETLHLLSFASLTQNPNAVQALAETINEMGGVTGSVNGLGPDGILAGVAQHTGADMSETRKELGRMVELTLLVPA